MRLRTSGGHANGPAAWSDGAGAMVQFNLRRLGWAVDQAQLHGCVPRLA